MFIHEPSHSGTQRIIFHVDLDAFFCSVEEIINPKLAGAAFVVGGSPQGRGVVSSASYPARAYGVRNAMPTALALRLCPKLIILPVRHGTYSEYSSKVMNLLRDYCSRFEQLSIDEAFLDITGIKENPHQLAIEVQARIKSEIGLPSSIGVATNKLIAKMASGRAKPNGVYVVAAGHEGEFLSPMPVQELWGIGKATAARLERAGIRTIGDLADSTPEHLVAILGEQAYAIRQRAHGIDDSLVYSEHAAKTISSERTFTRDVSDQDELRLALLSMCDEVAARLRMESLYARTVQLKLRWPDFNTITRQVTLTNATQLGDDIFQTIEELWRKAWQPGERVRLLGVCVSELKSSPEQLALFDDGRKAQQTALAYTTDRLRAKYGDKVIGRASLRKPRAHRK